MEKCSTSCENKNSRQGEPPRELRKKRAESGSNAGEFEELVEWHGHLDLRGSLGDLDARCIAGDRAELEPQLADRLGDLGLDFAGNVLGDLHRETLAMEHLADDRLVDFARDYRGRRLGRKAFGSREMPHLPRPRSASPEAGQVP